MDHVVIADNVTLANSILCGHVQVQEKVTVKDSNVGDAYNLLANTEVKGEALVREEQ